MFACSLIIVIFVTISYHSIEYKLTSSNLITLAIYPYSYYCLNDSAIANDSVLAIWILCPVCGNISFLIFHSSILILITRWLLLINCLLIKSMIFGVFVSICSWIGISKIICSYWRICLIIVSSLITPNINKISLHYFLCLVVISENSIQ